MTTTDANGIIRWETTDPITPLEATLNAGLDSVSNAITATNNGIIHYAANDTARTALVNLFNPTASKPLYVHLGSAPAGARLMSTTDGTTWEIYDNRIGRGFSATGTGGGNLTTAFTAPAGPANLALAAGVWSVSARAGFTLSTAAGVSLEASIFTIGGTDMSAGQAFQRNVPSAAQGGTASFTAEFTRQITMNNDGTIQVRTKTSATGGTMSNGGQYISAIRVG